MFIDGQKVRCINSGRAGNFQVGKTYIIRRVVSDLNIMVIDDEGRPVLKAASKFEKVKANLPPPKNDYEWLDRVQQNFKD